MKIVKLFILLVLVTGTISCASTKLYIDPQYKLASQNQIKRVSQKYPARIEVEFQSNGKLVAKGYSMLRKEVMRSIRETGVIISDDTASMSLMVVANSVGSADPNSANNFGIRSSLGLTGKSNEGKYEFSITMIRANGKVIRKIYSHAIIVTEEDVPKSLNLKPVERSQAFGIIVKDAILNFLKDMQDKNLLS